MVLTAWVFAVAAAHGQDTATPVGVDEVKLEPMSQTVPVIGRLVAVQSGVVAARTSGPVAELRVREGDYVNAGDVLALLDQDRLETVRNQRQREIEEQQALKATAEARDKLAAQELQRLEKLRNTAAFAESLYDSRVQELAVARSSLLEADARIASGQARLRLAEIELRDSVVRAPFPGAVTLRHTSAGAWLRIGDPVVTLVNDRSLEIEADIPATLVLALAPEVSVGLRIDGLEGGRARVRAVIPDENPASRTRPVRFTADLSTMRRGLAANQSVTVDIPAGREAEVISVHKDAVLRKGQGAIVFVVTDGVAKPRPVVLGRAVGQRFQVLDGLDPGEQVVVRGNERLRPGQAVVPSAAGGVDSQTQG
jgi:RND family efflux transporter MFP subunit